MTLQNRHPVLSSRSRRQHCSRRKNSLNSRAAGSDDRPRATRVAEGPGWEESAPGLARHLGWPVMAVRIAFVALATFQFIGVTGPLWLLLPPESTVKAPGLESASRAGMRDHGRPRRRIDWGMLLALVALGIGLLLITQNTSLGISSQLFWPWRLLAPEPHSSGARLTLHSRSAGVTRPAAGWLAPFAARGGWPALVRVIVGLGLVGAAFGIVIAQQGQIAQLPEVMAMTMLALAGLAIVLAPWLHRPRSALNQARAEKVRSGRPCGHGCPPA